MESAQQQYFAAYIMPNLPYILLIVTGLIFCALVVFIAIIIKLAKLNKRYQKMMTGVTGENLEQLLHSQISEVRNAVEQVKQLSERCQQLDETSRTAIQKVGVVRFNAFNDTGSDLSFAIALLDGNNNGVVITSLFGRNESRVYAKPIQNGQSTYLLTTEEKEALNKTN